MSTPHPSLVIARSCTKAGLSTIPIRTDGSKIPAVAWEPFQDRIADDPELVRWFGRGRFGLGVVCGKVSGNLELLDFDEEADAIFPAWSQLVEEECPGLVARLTVVQTPRKPAGYHARYRCPGTVIPGNTKLAEFEVVTEDGKTKRHALIETRGEGGQGLIPGCPPECHPDKGSYELYSGPPLSEVQSITPAERDVLWRCAASFDRVPPEEETAPAALHGAGLRSGDDYCARGPDWRDILGPHGWTVVRESGSKRYWKRPGKDRPGWSATTGACTSKRGWDLFCVGSSNADPFPEPSGGKWCSQHNKFSAYALLNHKGDFRAAAKALAAQGYGDQTHKGNGRAKGGKAKEVEAGPETFALEPLSLRVASARKTPSGRLTATVIVLRDGQAIDQLTLTSSATGRRDAVRRLTDHLGDATEAKRSEIDRLLGRVLVAAEEKAANPAAREGEFLRDLVGPRLLADFRFVYRTAAGAYSETRGEQRRQDFIVHVPSDLIEAAEEAADAPINEQGAVHRPALVKSIRAEAEIVWSDLMRSLPLQADADLTADTEAAKQFRQLIIRMWTTTGCWEKTKDGDAKRASLISRTRTQIDGFDAKTVSKHRWRRIIDAVSAWWRLYEVQVGEVREVHCALAMQVELAHQVNVSLPGVDTGLQGLQEFPHRRWGLGPDFCRKRREPTHRITSGNTPGAEQRFVNCLRSVRCGWRCKRFAEVQAIRVGRGSRGMPELQKQSGFQRLWRGRLPPPAVAPNRRAGS